MISQKAFDLITEFEGCDLTPNWPGGASGVTYGYGYDCGYNNREQIQRDWAGLVNGNVLSFMLMCSQRTGLEAKRMIGATSRTLSISQSAADTVFTTKTLPRFFKLAQDTYPGFDSLPVDAQGAIVSLVYNRGASFGVEGKPSWDNRREMRELAPLIAKGDLEAISDKIKEMTRIWQGKGLDGLIKRRIAEAALILN